MTKPKNPPLFDIMETQDIVYATSITLRDLFAAFALAGIDTEALDPDKPQGHTARIAYAVADAMLAERERK